MIHSRVSNQLGSAMSTQHKRPLCWVRRQSDEKIPRPSRILSSTPDDCRLSQILNKLKSRTIRYENEWRPVSDYENYLRILQMNGVDDEHIEKIRKQHIQYYEKNPIKEPEPLPDYSIPFKPSTDGEIAMSMTTSDDGMVSIRIIENPFKNFYDRSNTMEDYIEMYTKAGCSRALIERIRRNFEEKDHAQEEASRHFERVMSRYSGKSTTKVKKTSLRSRFAKSLKNTIIKAEDLEDDMGDEV